VFAVLAVHITMLHVQQLLELMPTVKLLEMELFMNGSMCTNLEVSGTIVRIKVAHIPLTNRK
jgi:hypothetical protein